MQKKHIEIKPFTWLYAPLSLVSRCDADIHLFEDDRAVVIVSDREDNLGIGIRDGVMTISRTVMDKHGIRPEHLTWIETRTEAGEAIHEQVRFETDAAGQPAPVRTPVDAAAVQALIDRAG
ncbi:hypothetical protein DENIS_4574 [Desulfonema ishimotonii]|uniref:Uncharacterized protein n=1 Tax=Desulfonema ishimotonii TaxID=45657 RepID=A0A401G2Y0_9BACT|nr:hypothetical protein [Desulfonema ishimotonii]GBC63576.1 hypothetical protein DENIS_4574 [Desulfonema ishimotonii]